MESLPLLPTDRRKAAAEAFVGQAVHALTPEQQVEIVEETLAVLSHDRLQELFGENSRAEKSSAIPGLRSTSSGSSSGASS